MKVCKDELTFDGGRTSSSPSPSLASMSSPQELKSRIKGEVRVLDSRGQHRTSQAHGKSSAATMRSRFSAETLINGFNASRFIKRNN